MRAAALAWTSTESAELREARKRDLQPGGDRGFLDR